MDRSRAPRPGLALCCAILLAACRSTWLVDGRTGSLTVSNVVVNPSDLAPGGR